MVDLIWCCNTQISCAEKLTTGNGSCRLMVAEIPCDETFSSDGGNTYLARQAAPVTLARCIV